jgi:dTDP-glucose 4,6-dehydratase
MTESVRRRTVVTGGAGFLGSHICTALLERGDDVLCIDDYCTGAAENIRHLLGKPGFSAMDADITEDFELDGPVDLVVHLASPASPPDYLSMPLHTLETGSRGTANMLAVARRHDARFLLTSTSEVYGDPLEHPQSERYWGNVNPVGPRSVYDEAKRYAEALTMAEHTAHGVNTAIVRLFNTYGPRMRANDGRAVPTFIRQALAGEPLTVAGDGKQTRSLTYVDDTVEGILAMADTDLTGPVNIGNDVETSVLAIARIVIQLTDSVSSIAFVERPVDDPARRRPDISLARDKLGWEPRTPLNEGLRRTIAWFRHQLRESEPQRQSESV